MYIDTVADQDEGYDDICPLPTSVCLRWWVNHAHQLKSVHLKGHSAGSEGSLGMYNLGLLTLLSSFKLTVLHLDDCFENGAQDSLVSVLARFVSLTQLRLTKVGGGFVDRLSVLCCLTQLKRLELQGMEHGVIEMNSRGLPDTLEVLGLALVGISGWLDSGRQPLANLKVLKLVHVEWQGPFCSHVSCLTSLEGIVINNVYVENQSEELVHWSQMRALEKLKHLEVGGEHEPAFSQCAGEQAIENLPFRDLSRLCLKFQFRSSTHFLNRQGQFTHLTQLYLECFDFRSVPASILDLAGLEQLGLVDCELTSFPRVAESWVRSLKLLDISKNKFSELPRTVTKLTSLTDLSIAHNECLVCEGVNYLADLPDLMTLRLLEGECLAFDIDDMDVLEIRFRAKSEAYRLGCLFTMLQIKNPHCHLYL